jgi:hypothetical protein
VTHLRERQRSVSKSRDDACADRCSDTYAHRTLFAHSAWDILICCFPHGQRRLCLQFDERNRGASKGLLERSQFVWVTAFYCAKPFFRRSCVTLGAPNVANYFEDAQESNTLLHCTCSPLRLSVGHKFEASCYFYFNICEDVDRL